MYYVEFTSQQSEIQVILNSILAINLNRTSKISTANKIILQSFVLSCFPNDIKTLQTII